MTRSNSKQKRKQRKYPVTLAEASKLLGVSKPHLSLVLRQKRTSYSLTERYNALVKSRKACA